MKVCGIIGNFQDRPSMLEIHVSYHVGTWCTVCLRSPDVLSGTFSVHALFPALLDVVTKLTLIELAFHMLSPA